MPALRPICRLLAATLLLLVPGGLLADGIGISTVPDNVDPQTPAISKPFHPYRQGTFGQFTWRDLEFHWDRDYTRDADTLTDATVIALDLLRASIVDSPSNPFGAPYPDFRLIYDYFRLTPANYNPINPVDSTSVVIGREHANPALSAAGYPARDRSHVDFYLPKLGTAGNSPGGGQYPSNFRSDLEDVTTGDTLRPWNAVHCTGPPEDQLDNPSWTGPASPQVWGFNHEMQHALPGNASFGWQTEMFSAAAEAVGGVARSAAAIYEVPYTMSLLAYGGSPPNSDGCGRPDLYLDANYGGRRLFAAYLAYSFPGADTNKVIPTGTNTNGFGDDLLWKWVRTTPSSRTLASLRSILSSSPTYIAKIDTAGQSTTSMTNHDLLQLLHHNWRVANYLNAPQVFDGRYGYPLQRGFSPSEDAGAWKVKAGDCGLLGDNDVLAIPPKVSLAHDWKHRSITRVGLRWSDDDTTSYPMALQPFGAEYWIARSGDLGGVYGRSLVVTVSSEKPVHPNADCGSGRLMASVASYGAQTDSLWRRPEWVRDVTNPQWADVDELAPELEFVVPEFGNPGGNPSRMAAVTTISLGDNPAGTHAGDAGIRHFLMSKYRITHDLVKAPYPQPFATPLPSRIPIVGNVDLDDLSPAWSPGGQEIVYSSDLGSSGSQIYRRAFQAGNLNQAQTLVHGASGRDQLRPDWSPRGDWVVFEQDSSGVDRDLFLKHLSSGATRRVSPSLELETSGVFRPDGQGLAYVRKTETEAGKQHELRYADMKGTIDSLLVGPGDAHPFESPRWEWDGSRVYFTRRDTLYSVQLANGLVQTLPTPLGNAGTSTLDVPRGAGNFVVEENAAFVDTCYQLSFPQYFTQQFRRLAVKSPLANGPSWARFQKRATEFFGPRISLDGTRVAYALSEVEDPGLRDINVGVLTYDHPPVMNPAAVDSTILIGNRLVVNLATNASDADGDAIYYKAAYLPPSATFSGSTFVWENPQPVGSDSTRYVVFVAYDSAGAQDYRVVRYTLVPGGAGGGCPFADVLTGSGWIEGNSISKRSASLAPGVDAYRLPEAPVLRGGRYSVRIRENEAEESSLDGVSLLLVDHAPGMRTLASGERILQGSFLEPGRVTDADGADLTDQFVGEAAPGRTMNPGEALLVEFGSTGAAAGMGAHSSPGTSSVNDEGGGYGMESGGKEIPEELRTRPPTELASAGPDDRILGLTGIDLQIPDGQGGWRTVERHYPRERLAPAAFEAIPPGPVRMLFAGRHQVRGFGRIVPATSVRAPLRLEPILARHSRLGDVRAATTGEGGGAAALVEGDTLTLEFAASPPEAGLDRDFYLVTHGAYRAATGAAGTGSPGMLQSAPLEFALGAARPNPSRGVTTIPFSLPNRAAASLRIYNASGRLVRTLVARELEAGRHEVEWDRRAEGGARVAAGMYFYQLVAIGREATRKVVILGD